MRARKATQTQGLLLLHQPREARYPRAAVARRSERLTIVELRRGFPFVMVEIEYRGQQVKIENLLAQSRSLEASIFVSGDAIYAEILKISRGD